MGAFKHISCFEFLSKVYRRSHALLRLWNPTQTSGCWIILPQGESDKLCRYSVWDVGDVSGQRRRPVTWLDSWGKHDMSKICPSKTGGSAWYVNICPKWDSSLEQHCSDSIKYQGFLVMGPQRRIGSIIGSIDAPCVSPTHTKNLRVIYVSILRKSII